MSGPSKQPHNAGQTVIVQQVSPMPVKDINWGPITITENWGRLFIRWNGQEVIALMGHYPKLVEAIQHFIEPATRTPDPAQIRADALRELLMVERIDDVSDVCRTFKLSEPHFRAALRTLLDAPLSPPAVDNSPAPDAGGKGEAK